MTALNLYIEKNEILDLKKMTKFETAKIIYNHLHNLLPPDFDNYFNKVVNTLHQCTRFANVSTNLPYLFVYKSENFVPNIFQKLKGRRINEGATNALGCVISFKTAMYANVNARMHIRMRDNRSTRTYTTIHPRTLG